MLPHIKHVHLWIPPSGCSAPENFTGPDTHTSLSFALSSFQRALLEASLTWHQTMEAFLVLLLGCFHLVLSRDMSRNRHWACSTCWRAFSLLEVEEASPRVLRGHKALCSTPWTTRAAQQHAETYTRLPQGHSSHAYKGWNESTSTGIKTLK